MKKIILMLAAVAFLVSSCNDEKSAGAEDVFAEVSFSVDEADFVTLKLGNVGGVPICSENEAKYAKFILDEVEYITEVYFANGKYVTQPIKVPVDDPEVAQTLELSEFMVHDAYPDGDLTLIKAAPAAHSDYWGFVEDGKRLPLSVTVNEFEKKENVISVLCYDNMHYLGFGFTWFNLEMMTIRRLCFFGDICTGKLDQYTIDGSPYASQAGYDLVAIAKVDVYKKEGDLWTSLASYNNYDNPVGSCLEIAWPDYDDVPDEEFKIDLSVMLPVGTEFKYIHKKSWEFKDSDIVLFDPLNPPSEEDDFSPYPNFGTDGVVDYVVGNCAYDYVDYEFLPHQNIPTGDLKMEVVSNNSSGFYWTLNITTDGGGQPVSGYDFETAKNIGAWCGDEGNTIGKGTYDVKAYSSLNIDPDLPHLSECKLSQLNYLFNHIGDVIPGFDYTDPDASPGLSQADIQNAIWHITDGATISTDNPLEGIATAYDCDYVPRPGELAAIIFYDGQSSKWKQILFTVVDP